MTKSLGAAASLWMSGLIACVAVLVWSGPGVAQGNKAFTIADVKVDVTSTSSADARRRALADGQQRAFQRLMRRIVISDDLPRVPKLSKANIDEYVLDFAVANEKNSPVRYLADLTYRFKPQEVRNLLRDLEINFAETLSKPVLLLPVYEVAAAKALWDDPNPWKATLAQLELSEGLVPISLPGGDLRDIGLIGAEQAVAGDEQRIEAIGLRYRVNTVMVAHAALATGPRGRPAFRINVISYGSDERAGALENFVTQKPGEKVGDLLRRAAELTVATIEDRWKEDNLIQFEQNAVLAATLPINSLTEWVEARKRLSRIAVIQKLDLVLFSRNEARINIFYLGDADQLSLALAQADMKLRQEEGNWMLRLAARGQNEGRP